MSKHERKHAPGFSNFGFSTILLAFVMICIVTISALSLLTANSDYKLSQKVADKNTAYYEAEKKAYETLSKVDRLLADTYHNSNDANDYYEKAEKALLSLGYGSYDKTTTSFSYHIDISENQTLQITLTLCYPTGTDESFFQIHTWKSIYDIVEPEEGTLDLID